MGMSSALLLALLALLGAEGTDRGRAVVAPATVSADGAALAFAWPTVPRAPAYPVRGSARGPPAAGAAAPRGLRAFPHDRRHGGGATASVGRRGAWSPLCLSLEGQDGPSRGAAAHAGANAAHADAGGDGGERQAPAAEPLPRYPVPVLGPFAVADAEVNVATPPPAARRRSPRAWGAAPSARGKRGKAKDKPGFKPVAGLGAMLGFLAAGPAGALAGAAASVATSGKDGIAGDTVRTAAKAAETIGTAAWDVTSKAADAANVEGFVRRGIDEVDSWTSDGRPPKSS